MKPTCLLAGLVVTLTPTAAPTPAGCPVPIPAGATLHDEPCGESTEQICGGGIPNFPTLLPGDAVAGTAWALRGQRDTDWFFLDWPGGDLNLTLDHDLAAGAVFFLLDPCPPYTVFADGSTPACTTGVIDVPGLAPGLYGVFIAQDAFDAAPCPPSDACVESGVRYAVTVSGGEACEPDCPPTGACCLSRCGCLIDDEAACVALGGVFSPRAACDPDGACIDACPADVNLDGAVDAADLNDLLAEFGACGPADLNCDGATDAADLNQLLAAFGAGC